MESSQLVELLKIIKPPDKEYLVQFAAVGLFNNGRMRAFVGPLIAICLNYPWQDQDHSLTKDAVYAALFPRQDFVAGKLEKVMVEAQKVVRSFLLAKNYAREENEFQQHLDFAEITRKEGLMARYHLSMARVKKIQEEDPWRNAAHFQKQILLEFAVHYMDSLNNQGKGDINIINLLRAIETFYYLRRVALLSRYLLQQRIAKLDVPDLIRLQIEENDVPERHLQDLPQLKINFEIFNTLKKDVPSVSDIQLLLDLLQQHEKAIDLETLQEFYAYLRNFTVLLLTSEPENEDFNLILHNLYKDNLVRGYLHYEGKLSPGRYFGVASNALKVRQFDWALDFILRYKEDIYDENEAQDIFRFNMANYLFAVDRFDECLDYIPASSDFTSYFLFGKRIELKAYYELQSDLLAFKLDAFRMYLSRTSHKLLSDTQRQLNNDFCNFLLQLISSVHGDQKRSELLVKRLNEKKQMAEWQWLLAKVKALAVR